MRTLVAFLVFTTAAVAQPTDAFVTSQSTHINDDGFSISNDQRYSDFPGYVVDTFKVPCIGWENFFKPHPNAELLQATFEVSATLPNETYVLVPIVPDVEDWLNPLPPPFVNRNYAWFDAWSDGDDENSPTYMDLVDEDVLDFDNNRELTYVNGKYRGGAILSNTKKVGFMILATSSVQNQTFTNPIIRALWGRYGDVNGDYLLTVDDIDIMQVSIQAEIYSPAADWDGDDDLDNDDVQLFAQHINLTPGDANADGLVNVIDFNILAIWMFTEGTYWSLGDFNSDGVTDGSDFNIWNDNRTDI